MTQRASGTLAILAGSGQLPVMVARGARRAGRRVLVLGLRGQADPQLAQLADVFKPVAIARIGRWIRLCKKFSASELIMAGAVTKHFAFQPWRILAYLPDWRTLRVWYCRARTDRRNLALLEALAQELASEGITVTNSVKYCPEALVQAGFLTGCELNANQSRDLEFAWPLALKVAQLDIGQAIVVKDQDVIAVEAIEGTDAMIARAGKLAGSGWILVKVAQAHQDMRFDVPTVGPRTIENLHKHGGSALIIQAKMTIVLEQERTIELAQRYGIPILAR